MARLIAADSDAAELRGHRNVHHVETAADPVRSALAQPSAVLVLAGRDESQALIATIRSGKARQAEELASGRKLAAYEATGFLGLEDVAVYGDAELEERPKPWWKRIFNRN